MIAPKVLYGLVLLQKAATPSQDAGGGRRRLSREQEAAEGRRLRAAHENAVEGLRTLLQEVVKDPLARFAGELREKLHKDPQVREGWVVGQQR